VQTERAVPSPIFIAALLTVARLRIIRLPDGALTVNDEVRGHIVKPIIIDHWRENDGRVPAFGVITGYVLVVVAGYGGFDFGLPHSVTGDRTGAMQKVERLGKATLGTRRGDTHLTGLLKDSPIRGIPDGRGRKPTGNFGIVLGRQSRTLKDLLYSYLSNDVFDFSVFAPVISL
jgi:hypothetical protein